MKMKIFSVMILIALCIVACNDNDDPALPQIAGSYNGYTVMDSGYFKGIITEGVTITITSNEDGTINVTFNELIVDETKKFAENTFANVEVEVDAKGIYTFSSEGVFVMVGMSGDLNNQDCIFTGTISADKSEVNLVYSIPSIMQGTTITFRNGEAPATR